MYLAEDRILCLGIFTLKENDFTLIYVPNAVARTDAVDTFEEFMLQRRRWINSSWFALDYVLRNYQYKVMESKHSILMKYIWIRISMINAILGKFNTFSLNAFFFFVVYLISREVIVA